MAWDLISIGVPKQYRAVNPFALADADRLDAFPALANPKFVQDWMDIEGDPFAFPHLGWQRLLLAFDAACRARGQQSFVLKYDRRNKDEEARTFLTVSRRRIRGYLDKTSLVKKNFFDNPTRVYTRNENSWWLKSQGRILKDNDGDGIAIGQSLQRYHKWLRTRCPEYRASQSWYRWIQPGLSRVGWSSSGSQSWLWYEIRCPHMLGVDGDTRHLDEAAFAKHADSIWLPIVRSIRWFSTSNPKTWNL